MKLVRINIETLIAGFFKIISPIILLYCLFNPIKTSGGELLFLLPLAYVVCIFSFPKLVEYQKGGWGLKIFYTVITVRYLLVPFLTCMQGRFSIGGIPAYALTQYSQPESYRYAIIAMVLEILVSLFVINKFYDSTYNRISNSYSLQRNRYPTLGIIGIAVTLFFIYLMHARGGIQEYIRVGIVKEALDVDIQSDGHGIDIEIIKPLMGFWVITITGTFRRLYENKPRFYYFLIPILVAVTSCFFIVGDNRMTMVYLALCAIAVLTKAFPAYSRRIYAIIIPTMAVILVSFTLMKQFNISLDEGAVSDVNNDDAIVGLTEYVCGPENTAHTYDIFLRKGLDSTPKTMLTDFLKFNHCLRLPVLSEIKAPVKTNKTIIDLAVERFEMVSVAGQSAFYGHGMMGGWLFDVIAFFFIARLLVFFEVKSKTTENLGQIYIYNWCAILFGVSMCYCLVTLWDNITYVPLWIWVLLNLNNIFKFSYRF